MFDRHKLSGNIKFSPEGDIGTLINANNKNTISIYKQLRISAQLIFIALYS